MYYNSNKDGFIDTDIDNAMQAAAGELGQALGHADTNGNHDGILDIEEIQKVGEKLKAIQISHLRETPATKKTMEEQLKSYTQHPEASIFTEEVTGVTFHRGAFFEYVNVLKNAVTEYSKSLEHSDVKVQPTPIPTGSRSIDK